MLYRSSRLMLFSHLPAAPIPDPAPVTITVLCANCNQVMIVRTTIPQLLLPELLLLLRVLLILSSLDLCIKSKPRNVTRIEAHHLQRINTVDLIGSVVSRRSELVTPVIGTTVQSRKIESNDLVFIEIVLAPYASPLFQFGAKRRRR
jgi:hypothetical protein